jgi:SAM-dependent methyltransferase
MDSSWEDEPERYDRMLCGFGRHAIAGANVIAGDHVVDVGAGASEEPIALAKRVGASGTVCVVEIDPRLAEAGRRRCNAAGFPDVEYVVADAATHEFEPASVDSVVSRFALMLAEERVFANLATAVRPGGRLAFTSWQGVERNAWFTLPMQAMADVVPELASDFAAAPPFRLADRGRIERLLDAAGWREVRVEPLAQPVWLGRDLDDVAGFFQRRLAAMQSTVDEVTWSRLEALVTERLAPYAQAEGVRVPAAAWLVSATRP